MTHPLVPANWKDPPATGRACNGLEIRFSACLIDAKFSKSRFAVLRVAFGSIRRHADGSWGARRPYRISARDSPELQDAWSYSLSRSWLGGLRYCQIFDEPDRKSATAVIVETFEICADRMDASRLDSSGSISIVLDRPVAETCG